MIYSDGVAQYQLDEILGNFFNAPKRTRSVEIFHLREEK